MQDRIETLKLDEKALLRHQEYKHERDRAVTDILKHNVFSFQHHTGPFALALAVVNNKVILEIEDSGGKQAKIEFSLMSLRPLIKDYGIICESYFEAVRIADPRKTEAIDMGRRGLHNEGAEALMVLLAGKIGVDFETARRLFTLIYVLQLK